MEASITDFLNFLTLEKGFSGNTLAAYRNDLTQFFDFVHRPLGDAPGLSSWAAVTRPLVAAFVVSLKERGYAPATVARKTAAVKSFFHFLLAEGAIGVDPTEGIDSPKVGRVLPRAISEREVDALLEQPGKLNTPEAMRDRAMLQLLYATGMRVTELVSLNLDDINLQAGYVRCLGRGPKERLIPIHPEAAAAVADYLQGARNQLLRRRHEPALFLNHRGERLTRQGFWLIVKAYSKAANIETEITPHTLRHTFAAHMLTSGADLRSLQELLGHANISTTQIYTHLANKRLEKAFSSAETRRAK
jgi:integrase/recombinase XerD